MTSKEGSTRHDEFEGLRVLTREVTGISPCVPSSHFQLPTSKNIIIMKAQYQEQENLEE